MRRSRPPRLQDSDEHQVVVTLNGSTVYAAPSQHSVRRQPMQLQVTVPEASPCQELHGYGFAIRVRLPRPRPQARCHHHAGHPAAAQIPRCRCSAC